MHRLQLSDTPFTHPPAQDIGSIIDQKYYSLVEKGYPIVQILAREMSGFGLPLDSCYQYISTNHLGAVGAFLHRAADVGGGLVDTDALVLAEAAAGLRPFRIPF